MIHKQSENRVIGGGVTGKGFLQLFKELAEDAEKNDLEALDMLVTYIEESDDFVTGSYVPELHLVVRRVDE